MSLSQFFKPKYLLSLICLLFILTRLYKITEIPPSVYWDEASIGYNAYSIAQTGKDEWGKFLPIHFRAFGEFKLPVYIYSVVPFVKIFGLNEFSVRIPAVLFSLGVVIITYLLAKKITGDANIGLWSSFFISISPWFFIFSRTGYEATAGLMFYLLAIYLFLSARESRWYIFFSTLSFVLSVYSYNSFRIVTPLTILILVSYEFRSFKKILKQKIYPLILSLLLVILSVIPIYRLYIYDAGASRLQVVGGVNAASFLKNYISHFNPDFLLLGDKNLRSQQKDFGQIYFPQLLLILLGLLYIIGSKSKFSTLPLLLLINSITPAALTKESPHALRAIAAVPFISILSAMGVLFIKNHFPQKYLVGIGVIVILIVFFANYFINFAYAYPMQSSKDWQFGYKTLFTDFKDQFTNYDRVVISDEYAQPYIFALFYLKYDPEKFRQEAIRNSVDKWGFSTVAKFGKFEFRKVDLESSLQKSLVFTDNKIQSKVPIDSIKFLDGKIAFWVYQFKN